MDTKTGTLRVLVVGRPDGSDDLVRSLRDHADIVHTDSLEEALHSLRWRPADLVIGAGTDLSPIRESLLPSQATALIESINQAVSVFDSIGNPVYSNARMQSFADSVQERVKRFCVDTLTAMQLEAQSGMTNLRTRRFSFTGLDGGQYEVSATPVVDPHGRLVEMATVVWDVSAQRRLQTKIDAIDQAGRELVGLDLDHFAGLDTQKRLDLLEERILRSTRDILHFDHFEIRTVDQKTKRLDLLISYGMPADAATVELYALAEGNGICGHVAERGVSYLCPDTTQDARYLPGLAGARSSLTVPLRLHDRVIGVANFESGRPGAFTEDDKQFAEIFARYVALALHVLELLVTERQTVTGQVCQNVLYEITGPLNDMVTQAATLIEDYIGHDDIRVRMHQISESAVKIRESIREFTTGRPGVIGAKHLKPRKDDPILSNKRVLVADDEEVILETVRNVLSGQGCKVTVAADGDEALRCLQSGQFDLIVSDIKMPGCTGYDVFQAAKIVDPTIPFIFTTGFGYDKNHSIVKAHKEGGVFAVLYKPFKVDELLGQVRSALQARPTPTEGG